MSIRIFGALSFAVVLKSANIAIAQPNSYSDLRCQENAECPLLSNEKPDFSLEAKVIEVIDADTLKLQIYALPGLTYEISVRSRGVDAPEIFQPNCERERELGVAAKASVEQKFEPGRWVIIRDVENDKYGGRIVAHIDRWVSDRFKSLSEELLERQGEHAVPYVEGESYDWCES